VLTSFWDQHCAADPLFQELIQVGAFSQVDLDFSSGVFHPPHHGWTSGADAFELEIGNTLVYAAPLAENSNYFRELQADWLPYYHEDLRRERLALVLRFCRNNLAHIPLYAPRELYFQCFKRFYNAFEEFLQALFIAHRTYPIAYDKWVREGIVEILGLPELYAQLPPLFEVDSFESQSMVAKAARLEELIQMYIPGA
jgi:hypothetical protein